MFLIVYVIGISFLLAIKYALSLSNFNILNVKMSENLLKLGSKFGEYLVKIEKVFHRW